MIILEALLTLEFLIFALFFAGVSYSVKVNESGISFLAVVALGAALYWLTDVFTYMATVSIETYIIGTVTWLILGVVWSLIRWYLYSNHIANKLAEYKLLFLSEHESPNKNVTIENIRINKEHSYNDWKSGNREIIAERGGSSYPLKAREHKESIILWMMWWPMSIALYILEDIVTDLFNWLYRKTSKVMDAISSRDSIVDKEIDVEY